VITSEVRLAFLKECYCEHYSVDEDSWYSCPKSPDGCSNDRAGSNCNCGADTFNIWLAQQIEELKEYIQTMEALTC